MSDIDKEKKTQATGQEDSNLQAAAEQENSENLQEKEETPDFEEQLNQLNDRYLRLLAEYDNFKKRTQRERGEIYSAAAADVIEAILPVLDTISRAMEMDADNEGIKLIKKQFEDSLSAIGVERINAVGEQFDPRLHNAVLHIEDETTGSNTIVEEFAVGYKYKDRIIRHSMVKVAN